MFTLIQISQKNVYRCFVSQEGMIGIFLNILPETHYIVLFLLCHLYFVSMVVFFFFFKA